MKRPSPRLRAAARTRLVPALVRLEARELLSTMTAAVAAPTFLVARPSANGAVPSGGYAPSQIQAAYGFNNISFNGVKGDGTGQTIAIVDAYDDPNIQSDLNTFDTRFGLPATTVTRVGETGGAVPGKDSSGEWEVEESLDVEWAHAMAPGASILLVEAASANDNDLLSAVDYGAAHAGVVSMSWGGGEFSAETSSTYDGHFQKAGVAFVASSGDSGAPIEWPSASPNVLAVGGTSLYLTTTGAYSSEAGWSGTGGGPSAYFSQPSYQAGVVTQTTMRAAPDVAYDADPNTGYAVYDSFSSGGWYQVGGTSAGAPQWSALLAITDQGRALSGQPALNSASTQEVMTDLYKLAGTSALHDVTTGTSDGNPNYSAGPGYDEVTGIGSPAANLVVAALDGGTTTPPATVDHFVVTAAPTTAVAGNATAFTIVAETPSGAVDPNFHDTAQVTSTDGQVPLAYYSFNNGSATFPVTFKTAGSQTVTVTDTTNAAITVTTPSVAVSPAAASVFSLVVAPTATTAGTAVSATLTVRDAYGNVATGYTGTVQLTSTDGAATFSPATYAFAAADAGVHTFSVTFQTAGTQTVTARDAANAALTATSGGVTVSPAAPLNLSATAVSTSQIGLSWGTVAGATGYQVQRSTSATTGFTQVGTTAAGVTTYQDTGLTAGTTYYYRVVATAAGSSSAASNTASATTQGTAPVAPSSDSLWGTSYTPQDNATSYGVYELGVKFTSTTAGTVTGVRFYKSALMNGFAHVAHLWSSTGTLLATASFTNETSSGWQTVTFANPVAITANTTYTVSYTTGGGYYSYNTSYFSSSGVTNGPLSSPVTGGVYGYSGTFPGSSGRGMNFWADVVFSPTSSPSTRTVQSSPSSSYLTPATPTTTPTTTGTPVETRSAGSTTAVTFGTPFRRAVAQSFPTSSRSRGGIDFGFGGW